MILVQNHRLPLNGNNAIVLLLMLGIWSCSVARISKPSGDEMPVVIEEEVHDKPRKPKADQKEDIPDAIEGVNVEFQGKSFMVPPSRKDLNVTLILPYQIGFGGAIAKKRSELMMEYYSGAKLALKELENEGLVMHLNVIDSRNDTMHLKKILREMDPEKVDLIVGPIEQRQMELVANFASKKGIPVFSPLTTVASLPDQNKLFYNFQPDDQSRARALAKAMAQNHPGKKVVISGDGKSLDKKFTPILVQALNKEGIQSVVAQGGKWVEWSKYLIEKGMPLYIATEDQNYTSVVLGKLIASGREPVVYGDQKWLDFSNNYYPFWEKLNVHIVSGNNEVYGNETLNMLRQNYYDEYKKLPTRIACIGYDQFRFLGEAIMAFGTHFPTFINGYGFSYTISRFGWAYSDGLNKNLGVCVFRFSDGALLNVYESAP